jgi:B3 DNA binding domain
MQSKDDLYFESGWRDFVFDHSIQTGELLVFRYEGQSSFSVLLFDQSACEKKSAFSAQPSKYSKGESRNGQSVLQQQLNTALIVVKKEELEGNFSAPFFLLNLYYCFVKYHASLVAFSTKTDPSLGSCVRFLLILGFNWVQ